MRFNMLSRVWEISSLCVVIVASLLAPVRRAEAQHQLRFETTAEGEVVFIGNTLGLSNALDENGPGTQDSVGTFITTDTESVDDDPLVELNPWFAGTTNNWQANGSTAVLDLPENKDAVILYAELLWGGSWAYGNDSVSTVIDETDPPRAVTLSFEDGSSVSVTPEAETAVKLNLVATDGFDVHYYVRTGIVTEFVSEHGAGTYTVSGVPATQDHLVDSLNTAGWTLAVAYSANGFPSRNLAIWAGAQWVDENDEVDFSIDGFCTPPTGPVDGQALIGAMEGDANRPDDQVLIAPTPQDTFVALSSPNNPVSNFFGSQINDRFGMLDERGSFGDRNHDPVDGNVPGGRQGWDIAGVELSDDQLDNDQTSATLRATSTGDSYVTTLVAMSIDINAPEFDLTGAVSVQPTVAAPGDLLTYTVMLDNTGTADANNATFFFPLPAELTLETFELNGSPGDAQGQTVTNEVLSGGVDLGTIALGDSAFIEMGVRIDSVPEPPAEARFATRARLGYEYVSCTGQAAIATEVSADDDVIVRVPRLTTRIEAEPSPLVRGGTAVIRVVVESTGTADASGVTLVNPVPSGLDYQTGSTTLNGDPVADAAGMPFASPRAINSPGGSEGVLVVGEAATVAFNVFVPAGAPAMVTDTATVDPDGAGPQPERSISLDIPVGGTAAACGNGRIETGEACDDLNSVPGDGCSEACQVEPGYECFGEPSVCQRIDTGGDSGDVPDAGPDAGGDTDDEQGGVVTTESCGCSAGSTSGGATAALLWGLALLGLGRRRQGRS